MKPLVSILIPAYNAEEWIAYALQSAVAQTWQRKEIIVVNDGSSDRTAEVAQGYASKEVAVVSTKNQGAGGARNCALQLCQGDYVQWLDADDLLAPEKVERQLEALQQVGNPRILASSPWAYFHRRSSRARFVPTSMWQNLSPVEWLLKKLGENLHMQTATWLTSRELTAATGPWDTRLITDDDGEYFSRMLLASEGTIFVPDARVYYRITAFNRWSYIGYSDKRKEALLLSMKLHMQYLRSLEESDRVRKACLAYMRNWLISFYPERPDIVQELQCLASELQGHLEVPHLRRKYAWMRPIFGWTVAKWAQTVLPRLQYSLVNRWDEVMFRLESRATASSTPGKTKSAI
jgi:glycosyltransferase involved in cell wall biosynthesis